MAKKKRKVIKKPRGEEKHSRGASDKDKDKKVRKLIALAKKGKLKKQAKKKKRWFFG